MAASAAPIAPLIRPWRSKLRRLQNLSDWKRVKGKDKASKVRQGGFVSASRVLVRRKQPKADRQRRPALPVKEAAEKRPVAAEEEPVEAKEAVEERLAQKAVEEETPSSVAKGEVSEQPAQKAETSSVGQKRPAEEKEAPASPKKKKTPTTPRHKAASPATKQKTPVLEAAPPVLVLPPVQLDEDAGAAELPEQDTGASKPVEVKVKRTAAGEITLALALTAEAFKKRAGGAKATLQPRRVPPPPPAPPQQNQQQHQPAKKKVSLEDEIDRIMNAESPEELLGVDAFCSEEAMTKAWKKLVLLLHPDKLHGLPEEIRQAGQDALNYVHLAKEEMKRQSQEQCAEVPAEPEAIAPPRLLEAAPSARKYEVSWRLPETQDPVRPVEKYEIWGPRYFSEAGEPFDPVLLATLPPLQSHFVLVEEAPTQQDVMWAADRVRRPTLPLTVQAANGKGSSGPLTFELPWASCFPWLSGMSSVLCPMCLRVNPKMNPRGFTRCGSCGYNIPPEATIIVRCPECNGEALWNKMHELNCSSCLLRIAQAHQPQQHHQQWKPQQPRGAPPKPQHNNGNRRQW